jgi:hypothetical protein
MDLPGYPIDIVEFKRNYLTRPQSQSRQCENHRIVAASDRRIPIDAGEQTRYLIAADRARNGRERPVGHDRNRCGQVRGDVPAITRIGEKRPQCGGHDLRASHVETRNPLLHEIGHVDGTQLCERDLTIIETKTEKISDNWPVIYDRLMR